MSSSGTSETPAHCLGGGYFVVDNLLMLCTEVSLKRLLESGVAVNESGILAQSELSTSVLDLTDEVEFLKYQMKTHGFVKIVCS